MRSTKFFIAVILTLLVLAALIFFQKNFFSFFQSLRVFIASFFGRAFSYQNFQELKLENQRLAFELEVLKKTLVPERQSHYQEAEIYSRYPWSDQNLLIINFGADDGAIKDLPVLVSEKILLGKIRNVKKTQSEVLTIFDPSWRSSVAVGEAKIKVLLKGGTPPRLELIPLEAPIGPGDYVVNSSPEFPLNLGIGTAGAPEKAANSIWLTADLKTVYDLDTLEKVLVLTDFP